MILEKYMFDLPGIGKYVTIMVKALCFLYILTITACLKMFYFENKPFCLNNEFSANVSFQSHL